MSDDRQEQFVGYRRDQRLDIERLARMASVDGQWWQEIEPRRRRCSIALGSLVPSAIGWLIICGLTFGALVVLP